MAPTVPLRIFGILYLDINTVIVVARKRMYNFYTRTGRSDAMYTHTDREAPRRLGLMLVVLARLNLAIEQGV